MIANGLLRNQNQNPLPKAGPKKEVGNTTPGNPAHLHHQKRGGVRVPPRNIESETRTLITTRRTLSKKTIKTTKTTEKNVKLQGEVNLRTIGTAGARTRTPGGRRKVTSMRKIIRIITIIMKRRRPNENLETCLKTNHGGRRTEVFLETKEILPRNTKKSRLSTKVLKPENLEKRRNR